MFSCNDYNNLYTFVDWRLVFSHFMSTAFILCCSPKNKIVVMHCNTDENTRPTLVIIIIIVVAFYIH